MNRKIGAYLLGSVILGMLFSFCNRPKEVLSRKGMEKLMYDVYIAEAMIESDYQNFDTPEKKEALINEVFKKHKTTQAQWDTSLSYYSDKIEIYLKMNDSVKARLQRRQRASEQIMNRQHQLESLTAQAFSSSYIPTNYSFNEVYPKNGFRFKLDSTEISQKINNPDFHFVFNVIGFPAISSSVLQTMLMLEYKDTTIYRSETINENRNYALSGKKYIPDDTIRNITGFVRLQDTTGLYRNIRLDKINLGNPVDTVQHQSVSEPQFHEPQLMKEPMQPQ